MKRFITFCAVALLTAPVAALQRQATQGDPDKMAKAGSGLPSGWNARLDSGSTKIDGVNLMAMGAGFHFITGPAGIYYKLTDQAMGAYETHATFTQVEPSAHPEAYGLIIGGSGLDGPNQKYTYFLVRQDGMFLVKRRAGAQTPTVTNWTSHAAVKKPDASGKMTNTLSIDVGKDTVRFLVNGTEVSSTPRTQVDADGVAGLRINHNLNVRMENFGLKKQ